MKHCLLKDCCSGLLYGIIVIKDDTNETKIQNVIYQIKNKYYEDGMEDWTVEDIINDLIELGFDFDYIDMLYEDLEV